MITVDTNVLLHYLLRDDKAQAERSRRIFEREEHILLTDVVLAESVWTLIGRRFRATKADVVAVLEKLLQEPNARLLDDQMIWSALQAYRQLATDLADALIVHKALKTAAIDYELTAVYTFDTIALQLPNTAEAVAPAKPVAGPGRSRAFDDNGGIEQVYKLFGGRMHSEMDRLNEVVAE